MKLFNCEWRHLLGNCMLNHQDWNFLHQQARQRVISVDAFVQCCGSLGKHLPVIWTIFQKCTAAMKLLNLVICRLVLPVLSSKVETFNTYWSLVSRNWSLAAAGGISLKISLLLSPNVIVINICANFVKFSHKIFHLSWKSQKVSMGSNFTTTQIIMKLWALQMFLKIRIVVS